MSENYAVLIANFTCFCYEITFLLDKVREYCALKIRST